MIADLATVGQPQGRARRGVLVGARPAVEIDLARRGGSRYGGPMKALRVRVENGRILGEAPPGLPDGEFDVCLVDDGDEMDDAELAGLNEALRRGFAAIQAGRFRPASDVVADLRRR